jgi:hypothetical protein
MGKEINQTNPKLQNWVKGIETGCLGAWCHFCTNGTTVLSHNRHKVNIKFSQL